ncbi:MAG: flagellar motor switch protein FliN [Buchnera aphidicola (Brevicoryne brassicae)]|uniref:Flagellar motor switch protein FliN n=1 Tax=Buchnera aphidicola (Brevicoryne brassicae) TaxID=911343 RepID=A0AAJ5PUZ1_9GAMM|nr:flagellar motor switch protein FliN [Buchnera aphidicola]QCI19663.1 flagellar motor switch protein FliN [Buchnera aphidicola (Brevicoryne brassicae)]WAI19032.1 MAG: flagellar motor switch protein FliN [Buchnera aphidicola (Brevicoryne brassicae)]
MSNVIKNSDNKQSINSEKKNSENKVFNKNIPSQKKTDKNTLLSDSKKSLHNRNIILNTPINITVELGKSKIKIKDFLSFSKGSMLILDKLIKEPLDIFLNGHLIASGEIVVLENKYGLRITNIKNSLKTLNVLSET